MSKNGPGVFNGKKYILYYADASTEMAFVVPSFDQTDNESTNRVETDSAVENLSERLRPSLDLSNSNSSPSKQVTYFCFFSFNAVVLYDLTQMS